MMSFDDHRDPGDESGYRPIPPRMRLGASGFVPKEYLRVASGFEARAAGDTGYLRETFLGAHYYEAFAPPTRRARARRAIAEARRRLSEAVLVVRTGSTSYEDDFQPVLVEDYAREIRTIGECYLLVSGVTQRIVAVAGVRAGPDGLVVDGVPLPEGASLYRLWRPHQRYRNLPQPKPTASDAVLERWFVADLLAVGVEP